jgi:hypothetical protein
VLRKNPFHNRQQFSFQPHARSVQAVVDGRDWKTKKPSNRLLRLILQVKEDGRFALTLGQLIDRSKDSPQFVSSLGRFGRVRLARRRGRGQRHLEGLSPKDSTGLMADDLTQPGVKCFGRSERRQTPEGHQKRVLHSILRAAAIAQHCQRRGEGPVLMLADQFGERFDVTRSGSFNKLGR